VGKDYSGGFRAPHPFCPTFNKIWWNSIFESQNTLIFGYFGGYPPPPFWSDTPIFETSGSATALSLSRNPQYRSHRHGSYHAYESLNFVHCKVSVSVVGLSSRFYHFYRHRPPDHSCLKKSQIVITQVYYEWGKNDVLSLSKKLFLGNNNPVNFIAGAWNFFNKIDKMF
jgi:hypothetical protein